MALERKPSAVEDKAANPNVDALATMKDDVGQSTQEAQKKSARDVSKLLPVPPNHPNRSISIGVPFCSSRSQSVNWAPDGAQLFDGTNHWTDGTQLSNIFGPGMDSVPMPLEDSLFAAVDDTLPGLSSLGGKATTTSTTCITPAAPMKPSIGNTGTSTASTGKSIERLLSSKKKLKVKDMTTPKIGKRSVIPVSVVDRKRKATAMDIGSSVADFLKKNTANLERKYQKYTPCREVQTKPTDEDVLLGRGGLSNHHKGNVLYREHIEEFKDYYQSLETKDEKMRLSTVLVSFVRNYGGRFLEWDDDLDGWVEAENNKARKKCSQALREEKKQTKKRKLRK